MGVRRGISAGFRRLSDDQIICQCIDEMLKSSLYLYYPSNMCFFEFSLSFLL